MAFPTSPIDGQTYSTALGTGYAYDSTRTAWKIVTQTVQGLTGVQGSTGVQGATGLIGVTGAAGIQGTTGVGNPGAQDGTAPGGGGAGAGATAGATSGKGAGGRVTLTYTPATNVALIMVANGI